MTTLTADEITTFAEVFGHELTVAQMTHLEEWVTTHRAEAIVMHELGGWPEPQPSDGPEYHAEHQFWLESVLDGPTISGADRKRLRQAASAADCECAPCPHGGGGL